MAELSAALEIKRILNSGNFTGLAKVCEALELECSEAPPTAVAPMEPLWFVHLAAYLVESDLDNARFLWKRTPPAAKAANAELQQLWEVARYLWSKNYPAAHHALATVQWSPEVVPLIAAIRSSLTQRAVQLVSNAYSSISVNHAANLLGLSPPETIQLAEELGWRLDHSGAMLMPRLSQQWHPPDLDLQHLNKLTNYVIFLDS
mmetsp:Transcript_22561/g.38705  ORF Transcript_22561/g.38705 Transcript_22561/m.38705 type:complete len:204 (+) Transcript_22561:30-641(+)